MPAPKTITTRTIFLLNGKAIEVPYYPLWGFNKWEYMAAFIPAGLLIVAIIAVMLGWRPHVFGF